MCAKVLRPLHSEAATGSAGQVTFAECRGIQTARVKSNPAQPRTADQLAVRATQTTVSRAWAGITDLQRAAWEVFASANPETDILGSVKTLSGYNMYCRYNLRLNAMAKSLINAPPSVSGPASPAAGAATGGSGQISLTWTAYAGTAIMMEVWIIGPTSPGRKADMRRANLDGRYPAETSPKVISSLAAGFYQVYLRAISETDGQISSPILVTATAT